MKNVIRKKTISILCNNVKVSFLSCCTVLVLITSCSSNDDEADVNCANDSWVQSVETELDAWLMAAQVYGQDQSIQNCNSYKSAGEAYVDALDEIRECVQSASLSDFEEALQEAATAVNEISCE